MKPVETETTNTTYVAEGCYDLPATNLKYADGCAVVETCWELSDEELEVVNRTKRVYLQVWGGQPPVRLSAFNCLEDDLEED